MRSASLWRRLAVDLLLHFGKLHEKLLELREIRGAKLVAPQAQRLDLLLDAGLLALELREHGRRGLALRLKTRERKPLRVVADELRMLRRERTRVLETVGHAALREVERFLGRDDAVLVDVGGVLRERGREERAETRRVALPAVARRRDHRAPFGLERRDDLAARARRVDDELRPRRHARKHLGQALGVDVGPRQVQLVALSVETAVADHDQRKAVRRPRPGLELR